MSDGDLVAVERRPDSTWVVLSGRRGNALGPDLVAALAAAVAGAEPALPLVLAARGPRFCVGVDLGSGAAGEQAVAAHFAAIQNLLEAMAAHPAATVGVAPGPAVGAGADILLACDLRLGTPDTWFTFPGVELGVLLGTRRLHDIAGPVAGQWLFEGTRVGADEALGRGLLTWCGGDPAARAESLVDRMAILPPRVREGLVAVARRQDRPPAELLAWSLAAGGLAERVTARAALLGVGGRP